MGSKARLRVLELWLYVIYFVWAACFVSLNILTELNWTSDVNKGFFIGRLLFPEWGSCINLFVHHSPTHFNIGVTIFCLFRPVDKLNIALHRNVYRIKPPWPLARKSVTMSFLASELCRNLNLRALFNFQFLNTLKFE